MNNFEVKINITILSKLNNNLRKEIGNKLFLNIIKLFAGYILRLYIDMLESEEYSKRYKGSWEPIAEKGYQEYLGVMPKDSILSYIKNSLEIKKIGYNFFIRINPYEKYPGTNIPLVKVVRAIENGTSDFNARPLIKRISKDLQISIIKLWKGFLLKGGVI